MKRPFKKTKGRIQTSYISRFAQFSTLTGLLLCISVAGRADTLVQIFNQASQNADSEISWNQLGGDQTQVSPSTSLGSTNGLIAIITLAGNGGLISVICSDGNRPPSAKYCSWTGAGFPAVDLGRANRVLWTTDQSNGGTGPVTVAFMHPVAGAGALIQADAPGQFIARIEAFNGSTSLGAFTATSDSAGDAVYAGLQDTSGANITSVVFRLTRCSGSCADFALDAIQLNTAQ